MRHARKPEQKHLILGLESSGNSGGISLLGEGGFAGTCDFSGKSLHSQRLLPSLDWLLSRCDLTLNSLKGIAVSIGPGSFTGIRIGLSLAKSLSWQLNIPLVAVDTLEAIALNTACHMRDGGNICPVIDAYQGKFYFAVFKPVYSSKGIEIRRESSNILGDIHLLKDHIKPQTILTGEILNTKSDLFHASFDENIIYAPSQCRQASSRSIAILGTQLLETNPEGNDINSLVPNYVRPGYEKHL